MSKINRTLSIALAAAAGLSASMAHADDLNPPTWRGQPGSTFQHWTFNQNPAGAPDGGVNNPNGNPLMNPSDGGNFYNEVFGGRVGVWGVTGGSLNFRIPNDNEPDEPAKLIWIQVTWQGPALPGISGVSSTDHSMQIVGDPQTNQLAEGWFHTTWLFSFKECPAFEDIFITNPGVTGAPLYIDQVVIDTICVPAPGVGVLACAGLVAVARRRR